MDADSAVELQQHAGLGGASSLPKQECQPFEGWHLLLRRFALELDPQRQLNHARAAAPKSRIALCHVRRLAELAKRA